MSSILHLYAIRADWTPFVKIGVTGNPTERIKRMQTETPHALRFVVCVACPQAYDIEYWLHGQLNQRRVRGEWFWLFRNRPVACLISQGLDLSVRGRIPPAPTPIERYTGTTQKLHDRSHKNRKAVIDMLVLSGWTLEDMSREKIFRGDNNEISAEVEAARRRLGIESGDHKTPIAGRPTSAEFPYQPPPR